MATSYNIFHESVPADERTMLFRSNLYRPTLGVCTTSKILVSHVGTTRDGGLEVTLMLDTGFPVLFLTEQSNHYYAATTDNAHTLSRTTICDTTNPMYLIKSLYKSTKGANEFAASLRHGKDAVNRMMIELGVSVSNFITDNRKISMDYRPFINNEICGQLLQVFFGERNAIDVSPEQRQVLESARAERDQRVRDLQDVTNQMTEMFSPVKWLVSYLPDHGYTVQQVHASDTFLSWFTASHASSGNPIKLTTPVTFCRRLEDLPVDICDQVLGTLTLAKMHLQSRYPESVSMYDAEPHDKLIHTPRALISQELNAVVESHQDRRSILISV